MAGIAQPANLTNKNTIATITNLYNFFCRGSSHPPLLVSIHG